jgi:hypothetical protein
VGCAGGIDAHRGFLQSLLRGLVPAESESLSTRRKDNPLNMNIPLSENFKKINSLLIERERKDATYKFALLRGAIEICEKSDQHRIAGTDPEWVMVEEL